MCGIGHRQPSDEEELVDGDTREGAGQDGQPVTPVHRAIPSLEGNHQPEQCGGDEYTGNIQSKWLDPEGRRLFGDAEIDGEYDVGR